jgi:hypothetical protein
MLTIDNYCQLHALLVVLTQPDVQHQELEHGSPRGNEVFITYICICTLYVDSIFCTYSDRQRQQCMRTAQQLTHTNTVKQHSTGELDS